ncbi:glycosyltransferase WbuB [Bacteroidia bacterium]|nr:glycosyltransferase WbuB [Bacteroidia bacterium]
MKILLLPAYYHPEPAASIYLSLNRNEDFIRAGFQIEMYVPLPTRGVSDEIRKYYRQHKTESLYDEKMVIYRFWMFREDKNPVFRAIRYALCCIVQFAKGCLAKDIDLIFATSTPPIQGAMIALLKKIKKVLFVYNLQDIFPDSLVSTGITNNNSFIWRLGRKIENFTYKNADKIIVISEDFRQNILAKGVPADKIEVIYNWVNENEVVDISRENNKLFEKYGLDKSKFYITYCGNIGLTQNMDMLLEIAQELRTVPDIQFVLIGGGVYTNKVLEIIENKQIKNVLIVPFQPYEDISHVFSLGNIGLIMSKPGTGQNSLPSKTWSIMSAERPVIANFDENELKSIIEDNRAGIFTHAGDKQSFKDGILYCFHHPEECREMGKNGRNFILKNLNRSIATNKYTESIKKLIIN